MIRRLAHIALPALLGLAACSGPVQLTKAKIGKCFTVVGREPGGAPKFEKTECLASAPTHHSPATTQTEVAAAAPQAAPHPARRTMSSGPRDARSPRALEQVEVVQLGEYARVTPDDPLPEPPRPPAESHQQATNRDPNPYGPAPVLPPPPPVERYLRREGYAYGEAR